MGTFYNYNVILAGNGMVYLAESPESNVILIADMSCSQSATSISQCSLTHYTKSSVCDTRHTAAVRCHSKQLCFTMKNLLIILLDCTEGSIRLIPYNSYSETIGRVEVCVDGTWGSICHRFFTDNDAQVVCRQLGYTALGTYFCTLCMYFLTAD